jgi:glycine/D-amino acid oxidase-like deaminating enzyme
LWARRRAPFQTGAAVAGEKPLSSYRFAGCASWARFDPRWLAVCLALLFAAIWPADKAEALELVLFDKEGCVWCARWERDIGRRYANLPEGRTAPLRRVDIRDQRRSGIALEQPVIYTPTFILTEEGEEIGRITGYRGEETFWSSLDDLLRERPNGHY